jgi:hypothetical protein
MKTGRSEVRECLILGHELEVYPSADGQWGVAVDGQVMLPRFVNAYAAWATGAAESYRQGRTLGGPVTSVAD